MTNEELAAQMLAFIEKQDGNYFDEWYASPRDFAATILSDFAMHLGVELVVPAYVPQLKKPEIDRNALWKELNPKIYELFNMAYDEYRSKNQ